MMNLSHFNLSVTSCWQVCFLFCLSALILVIPEYSLAEYADTSSTTTDGISQTLCIVVAKLVGPIGRGIATIAVVVLGIGLFLGKLSWGLAIATSIGIGLIFGAPVVVNWLSSSSATCSTS